MAGQSSPPTPQPRSQETEEEGLLHPRPPRGVLEPGKGRVKRVIIIPPELEKRGIREVCQWVASMKRRQIYDGVLYRLKRYYGYNTHSLRYAFIRNVVRKGLELGINHSIIAKIVNHRNPIHLKKYVEQYEKEVSQKKQQEESA